jgi:outer membrane protein assembly factor BamD (BamD/ComL family)
MALICFVIGLAHAQQLPAQEEAPKDTQISPDQLPPDEDKTKPQEQQYSFNPVQSKKEVTVGEFYFKKNDYRAAAGRFREATKWNDGNADAWLRLGDAAEKMKDPKAAREAWEKYLQLAPDAKNAAEVKKKLSNLKI